MFVKKDNSGHKKNKKAVPVHPYTHGIRISMFVG